MSTITIDEPLTHFSAQDATPASVWYAAAGMPITDEILQWPADLFALTHVCGRLGMTTLKTVMARGKPRPRV